MDMALAEGNTERGSADIPENHEQFTCTVTIPTAANLTAYKTFTDPVQTAYGRGSHHRAHSARRPDQHR